MAFGVRALILELRWNSATCAPFSLSEEEEFARLAFRITLAAVSESLCDRDPVLGLLVLWSSSKQEVHPTGRPSVTINGVGP